jgi:arylesterase/paraoxonase
MVNLASKLAVFLVVLIAILYQFIFKSLIFDTLGYGRSISAISAFNVKCKKIDQLGLEACEDMWLDDRSGYLYMACSDSETKTQWLPAFVHNLVSRDL